MTPNNEAKIMEMLGNMKGMLESHATNCDKNVERFDRDIDNIWSHEGQTRERVAKAETNIKNIDRQVFRTGVRAGSIAGGTAGTIITLIAVVLRALGYL